MFALSCTACSQSAKLCARAAPVFRAGVATPRVSAHNLRKSPTAAVGNRGSSMPWLVYRSSGRCDGLISACAAESNVPVIRCFQEWRPFQGTVSSRVWHIGRFATNM